MHMTVQELIGRLQVFQGHTAATVLLKSDSIESIEDIEAVNDVEGAPQIVVKLKDTEQQ